MLYHISIITSNDKPAMSWPKRTLTCQKCGFLIRYDWTRSLFSESVYAESIFSSFCKLNRESTCIYTLDFYHLVSEYIIYTSCHIIISSIMLPCYNLDEVLDDYIPKQPTPLPFLWRFGRFGSWNSRSSSSFKGSWVSPAWSVWSNLTVAMPAAGPCQKTVPLGPLCGVPPSKRLLGWYLCITCTSTTSSLPTECLEFVMVTPFNFGS